MIRYYIHNSPFGPRRGRLRQRAAKTHVDIWLMDILFNKQDIQCCYLLCFPVPLDDFSVLSTTVTTYPPSVATFMNIGESGIFSSISLSSCKSYTSTNVLPFSMRWTQLLAPLGRALWSESRLRAMVQKKCHTLSRRSTFAMTAQHKTQKKHQHKEWLLYIQTWPPRCASVNSHKARRAELRVDRQTVPDTIKRIIGLHCGWCKLGRALPLAPLPSFGLSMLLLLRYRFFFMTTQLQGVTMLESETPKCWTII